MTPGGASSPVPLPDRSAPSIQEERIDSLLLLDEALAIVREEGLGGLTLRPLAKRMGYSIGTFARLIGSKDQMLDHLFSRAAGIDASDLGPWRRMVSSFSALPPETLAEITEEVLRQRSGEGRNRSILRCELVQAAAFHPEMRPALRAWLDAEREFWALLVSRCAAPPPYDLADALLAFALDDAARSLFVVDAEGHNWMRREMIRRLWLGLHRGEASSSPLFEHAVRAQSGDVEGREPPIRVLTDARERMLGEIVGSIILESGPDAVTHREVARLAGVPHSSIAYHFPQQDHLVELGILSLAQAVRSFGPANDAEAILPEQGLRTMRICYALSLVALHRPNLRPLVRALRRRRSTALLPWLHGPSADSGSAGIANGQATVAAIAGAVMLERAGMANSATLAQQFRAQLGE